MCRFLAYIGKPIMADELILKPKNSLMKQSYHALESEVTVNGDGFVFIKIDNKLKLSEMTALSLPLGVYTSFDGASLQFDPRFYFTPIQTDKFDLTFIPKCHIYGFDLDEIYPGISTGAGYFADFKKWVIRPEIGYDSLSLSA